MHEILNYSVLGNSILSYLVSLGIFLGGVIAARLLRSYALTRLKRWAENTRTSLDDLLIHALENSLIPFIYFGALYVAAQSLRLSPLLEQSVRIVVIAAATFLAGRAAIAAANLVLSAYVQKSSGANGGQVKPAGLKGLVSIVVWALALLFLLDNLGIKITAVLAGLGIGGVAVALASQALLRDLFSYFVIFFDKPFELEDFIIVGGEMGTVEHIGIKTTRIRALNGEQIVFSNTELTDSRIHNYKKMEKRRVLFKLGVTYQTRPEMLKAIPGIVQGIIESQADTTFDRGHFAVYGDFSLNFEFVYYVAGADYNKYMDIQQAINFGIIEAFAREKIEFAYPSQTIFIDRAGD